MKPLQNSDRMTVNRIGFGGFICLSVKSLLRMVTRLTGLEELTKWITSLSEGAEDDALDDLEEFIDHSYEE